MGEGLKDDPTDPSGEEGAGEDCDAIDPAPANPERASRSPALASARLGPGCALGAPPRLETCEPGARGTDMRDACAGGGMGASFRDVRPTGRGPCSAGGWRTIVAAFGSKGAAPPRSFGA